MGTNTSPTLLFYYNLEGSEKMSNGDCQPEREYIPPTAKHKVIQHIKIEYFCPFCNRKNVETIYSPLDDCIGLQCDYCGKCFRGE